MKHTIASILLILSYLTSFSEVQEHYYVKMAFVGDIMMGTTYPTVRLPADEGKQLFQDVSGILNNADFAAGNLEGVLLDGGTTKKVMSRYCYAFRTPTSFTPRLKEAGFDFLSTANNHANDFGKEGIESTRKCLDEQKIKNCGVRGYEKYQIVERNGIKYGICAFGHSEYTWLHTGNLDSVGVIIKDLEKQADIVVVSFHGGAEGAKHRRLPQGRETFLKGDRGDLRKFAHYCIDMGADVVYGHGPHVNRAVELYKDRFIAYSLGNFCTPYGINIRGISGYSSVLEMDVATNGTFLRGKIHSFVQQPGIGPRLDEQNKAAKEIRNLTILDVPGTPLKIKDDGTIEVTHPQK